MRNETLADKIWSGALIALPSLVFVLASIPGFILMFDSETMAYTGCSLWNPPGSSIMSNLCPLLLVIFAYTLVLTVCYYRSQALGTIKAIFIFSIVCLAVSALALLPPDIVKPMPYVLIPCIWIIMCVVSFIRMQLEIKRYDFD